MKFALAEPARVAIALNKCRYWQQDHWRIQVDRADAHIVQWDGSYWFDLGAGRSGSILRNFRIEGRAFDLGAGRSGSILRNFRIEGRAADPGAAADAVEKASPELAAAMRSKGTSAAFGVSPDPRCAS